MLRLGLQNNELASRLDISPSAVSNWLKGRNAPIGATLRQLATELGCSIAYLHGEEAEPSTPVMKEQAPPWPTPEHQARISHMRRAAIDEIREIQDRMAALERIVDGMAATSSAPGSAGANLKAALDAAEDEADAEAEGLKARHQRHSEGHGPTGPTPGRDPGVRKG
jgi:transcriptional regulator with XRE-family HTH domain